MMSASPARIVCAASPMASLALEQADVGERLGPRAPRWMLTCPLAMLGSSIGTTNGLRRSGPRSSMTRKPWFVVEMPPMPVPIITPVRAPSAPAPVRPACPAASAAAATAKWL